MPHARPTSRLVATLLALITGLVVLAGPVAPASAAQASSDPARPDPRIIGGGTAPADAWPSVVALMVRDPYEGGLHFSCGGTIIDPSWILTAAHCVTGEDVRDVIDPRDLRIRVGSQKLSEGRDLAVARIVVRPAYSSRNITDDIALVKLARPTDRPRTLEVASPTDIPWSGATVRAAGWGVANYDTFGTPNDLKQVDVPALSGAECQTALTEATAEFGTPPYHSSHLCTGPIGVGGEGPCYGDSGGPLVWETGGRKLIVGVVSWGAYCASPETPSVFSKVASASRWIDQTIRFGPHSTPQDFALSTMVDYLDLGIFEEDIDGPFPSIPKPTDPGAFIAGFHAQPVVTKRDATIVRLYASILGRRAENHGYQYWRERLMWGSFSSARMANVMARSQEFKTTYGNLGDQEFVETLYLNVLGRGGSPTDVDYWEARLVAGQTRGRIALLITESAENRARTQAEVDVQVAFLNLLRRVPQAYEIAKWAPEPVADLGRHLVHSVAYARRYPDYGWVDPTF